MPNIIDPPELRVAIIGITVVGGFAVYQVIRWVREAPVTPDPWDKETEEEVQQPDATQVCHKCFTPHPPAQWFCAHCGAAVGDYNNVMPYVDVFSQGEVLRNGVHDRMPKKSLIIIGYLLYTFSAFTIFAPVYWILFFRNLNRQSDEGSKSETNEPADNPA